MIIITIRKLVLESQNYKIATSHNNNNNNNNIEMMIIYPMQWQHDIQLLAVNGVSVRCSL